MPRRRELCLRSDYQTSDGEEKAGEEKDRKKENELHLEIGWRSWTSSFEQVGSGRARTCGFLSDIWVGPEMFETARRPG